MLRPIGFWSYSSSDDEHSRGRLSQLRALLAAELQQKIGRSLKVNIFQDVAAIPPGAEWEKQIYDAINAAYFLIPIVTPALLQSEWCCQEIRLFWEREAALRRSDLIFPLYYVGIDDLDASRRDDCHDPEVLSILRSRQWIDFRRQRLKNPDSEDVALSLEAMADAICSALRRTQELADEAAPAARIGEAPSGVSRRVTLAEADKQRPPPRPSSLSPAIIGSVVGLALIGAVGLWRFSALVPSQPVPVTAVPSAPAEATAAQPQSAAFAPLSLDREGSLKRRIRSRNARIVRTWL
jgi:hypothetical protein